MAKAKSAASEYPILTCRPVLPVPEDLFAAAKTAVDINPANAVPVAHYAAATGDVLPPERIAVLTSKYWGARGVRLSVSFMDSPNAATRRLILAHANFWGKKANVKFSETRDTGQVRVARTPGEGYYSYLGVDILHVPKSVQTMNLDSFTEETPESEYRRVVIHEFGHTLGMPHEHQRAAIIRLLDPARTIAVFQRDYGWDAETTRQQVLTPLSERSLMGTAADVESIMAYSFSAECTKNGKAIPGGLDLDPADIAFSAKIYPKSL